MMLNPSNSSPESISKHIISNNIKDTQPDWPAGLESYPAKRSISPNPEVSASLGNASPRNYPNSRQREMRGCREGFTVALMGVSTE